MELAWAVVDHKRMYSKVLCTSSCIMYVTLKVSQSIQPSSHLSPSESFSDQKLNVNVSEREKSNGEVKVKDACISEKKWFETLHRSGITGNVKEKHIVVAM
jgi:hypothetical protein